MQRFLPELDTMKFKELSAQWAREVGDGRVFTKASEVRFALRERAERVARERDASVPASEALPAHAAAEVEPNEVAEAGNEAPRPDEPAPVPSESEESREAATEAGTASTAEDAPLTEAPGEHDAGAPAELVSVPGQEPELPAADVAPASAEEAAMDGAPSPWDPEDGETKEAREEAPPTLEVEPTGDAAAATPRPTDADEVGGESDVNAAFPIDATATAAVTRAQEEAVANAGPDAQNESLSVAAAPDEEAGRGSEPIDAESAGLNAAEAAVDAPKDAASSPRYDWTPRPEPTVADYQERYFEVVGRPTTSTNRGYLRAMIRAAEAGRIKIGPRASRPRAIKGANGSDAPVIESIDDLRARYLELIGRPTGSVNRAYLRWKIGQAEKGRISIGPRGALQRPAGTRLTLTVSKEAADALDRVCAERAVRNRDELLSLAVGAYLKSVGAVEEALHFSAA